MKPPYFISKVGDGSDLGAVLFVGGGTALLQSALGAEAFASIYKGKRLIAKDPEYTNARGMWKYGMFVLDPAERAVETPAAANGTRTKSARPSTVESV